MIWNMSCSVYLYKEVWGFVIVVIFQLITINFLMSYLADWLILFFTNMILFLIMSLTHSFCVLNICFKLEIRAKAIIMAFCSSIRTVWDSLSQK